jgi:hypothetical protein
MMLRRIRTLLALPCREAAYLNEELKLSADRATMQRPNDGQTALKYPRLEGPQLNSDALCVPSDFVAAAFRRLPVIINQEIL